jgi:serine/threonine protein kinase
VALQPSTRLGRYEIVSSIGAGGMGEVYRARDTRLDRTVAIKVLPEHLSRNPQSRERFEREAKAISSLSHPHICPLYDVGQQGGIEYLVMEFLEGETLAHRLKKGLLPPDQVLQYAVQITDALDTAHRHGVIHRDLKPGNIMLTKAGAKLLDFGLAKMRTAEAVAGMTALPTQTAPLTGEGAILGTLQYMAPEQLEGKEADARTDIFALGAVIYEMATARKAFAGKSQASLISAIMSSEPPSIATPQSMTPPALDHAVRTCLAKDPDARWQTASDVLVELKWIAGGGAISQVSAPADVALLRKRGRLGWIAAGCLLATLIAGGVMMYLRPAPEARVVQFEVAPPQNDVSLWPAISPDGQHMAYSAKSTSTSPQVIFLRSLNSLDTNPLPGTEGEVDYSWSPDSSQIAFATASALKKINITGGAPQVICNHTARFIAWNRDGVILFWGGAGQGLFRVAAAGGEPKPVTKLDPTRQEIGHGFTQFLPDGRHFIYLGVSDKPENSGTYLGSLDSPEIKRIHDGKANTLYAQPGYLIFIRGTSTDPVGPGSGTLTAQRFDIRRAELSGDPVVVADSVAAFQESSVLFGYFSVSQNGVLTYSPGSGPTRTQLAWFDRSGKRLGTLGEPADYTNPAVSRDQKMVAVGKVDPQTKTRDIWVNDLQRGTSSRLTFDPADDFNPTWSPDGARIAFSSDRKGHRDIYVKPASGVGEEQVLAESTEEKTVEDWSADGQYLVWGVDATGYEWLFSFRDHKILPFLQAKFLQDQCRFSPNRGGPPHWIAYASVETGARQVYVRSFAGALSGSGGKWQISTDGGSEPMWRGDSKELFYLNGNKLMAVEVNGDGESIRAGIPKELFEARLTPYQRRNRYIVTSDGKRFLMNALVEEQGHASIRVVLNWPGLLKR